MPLHSEDSLHLRTVLLSLVLFIVSIRGDAEVATSASGSACMMGRCADRAYVYVVDMAARSLFFYSRKMR